MTPDEQEQFIKLFKNTLKGADIRHVCESTADSYAVYNKNGTLFTITLFKNNKEYMFGCTNLFKSEYVKYGLPITAEPDGKMVYEAVEFAYEVHQVTKIAKKDISFLYNESLINSDILFQKRANFETYVTVTNGLFNYAIGYDTKTKQYGFKRYEVMDVLYKLCDIPNNLKPDYASLYKRTKESYLAQEALDNMQHIYD